MLKDYKKKPDSSEYYRLFSNNSRRYYFLSEEKARQLLEIQRDSVTTTEWTLIHVKDGQETVIDTARKKNRPSKNKEFNLDEMLEEIATEKTTPIRRIN